MNGPLHTVRTWSRGRRTTIFGAAALVVVLSLGAPALAAVGQRGDATDEPALSSAEVRQVERWWEWETRTAMTPISDLPLDRFQSAAEAAWAAGIPKGQLRTAVFSDAAWAIFASNRAGGEGRPSPYVEYFTNNATQLGELGQYLRANPAYVGGPGGTQDDLFDEFQGLRDSYLASLGLMEENGRIVDPRAPHLTPYFASLLLGVPRPLPQPDSALNVG